MTCQSFSSVSLDPPLVLFIPAKTSRAVAADPALRQVLRQLPRRRPGRAVQHDGQPRHRQVRRGGVDAVRRSPARRSSTGSLGHVDCTIHAVHEAGDHYVVIGRVVDLVTADDDAEPAAVLPGQVPHHHLIAPGHRRVLDDVASLPPQLRSPAPSSIRLRVPLHVRRPRRRPAAVRGSGRTARSGVPLVGDVQVVLERARGLDDVDPSRALRVPAARWPLDSPERGLSRTGRSRCCSRPVRWWFDPDRPARRQVPTGSAGTEMGQDLDPADRARYLLVVWVPAGTAPPDDGGSHLRPRRLRGRCSIRIAAVTKASPWRPSPSTVTATGARRGTSPPTSRLTSPPPRGGPVS